MKRNTRQTLNGLAWLALVGTSIGINQFHDSDNTIKENDLEEFCRLNAEPGYVDLCVQQETYCLAAPELYCNKINYKKR